VGFGQSIIPPVEDSTQEDGQDSQVRRCHPGYPGGLTQGGGPYLLEFFPSFRRETAHFREVKVRGNAFIFHFPEFLNLLELPLNVAPILDFDFYLFDNLRRKVGSSRVER
jgi:hypothetical protein